jgi:hypothetical protein
VHTEGPQHGADMVPHRLGAQMELLGDLPRRAAVLEDALHLGLARCERRMRRCRLHGMMEDLAEDADNDDPEGGGIEPADHARGVDDLGRDVDTLEGAFDVAADRLQPGHVSSVQAPLRAVRQR